MQTTTGQMLFSGTVMRYTAILLSTSVLLTVSACKTPRVVPSDTETIDLNVPLSAGVPFERFPAAHLQGYLEGYYGTRLPPKSGVGVPITGFR